MPGHLATIDALPPDQQWAAARALIFSPDAIAFGAELRERRPVWYLPELTLVSRHADCMMVLRRHQTFGVDLYEPKQGSYLMAQDDTAVHWRDKSVMKAILDLEDIPKIRDWVADRTNRLLAAESGDFDLVRQVTRGVPVALVQEWFGFRGANPDDMIEWSYWNQQDAFWNQPFDSIMPGIDQEKIVRRRKRVSVMMALYLGRLVAGRGVARVFGGADRDTPVDRLVRLRATGALDWNWRDVIFNIGGLLIGAVETTSHAVCNALLELQANPNRLSAARIAANADNPASFDGHVWEALRFRPAFPYFFRVCHRDTELAGGTADADQVVRGRTVLALTHSAMFDPAGFPNPASFDPNRDFGDAFTFGQGIHSCLGRHIAAVMVPEILRQILRDNRLILSASPDYTTSPVPQSWGAARH